MSVTPEHVPESAPPSRRQVWLVCIGLAAATFAIYAQVVTFEFVRLDDGDYIHKNQVVREGLTREGFAYAFRGGHGANWHPLTTLSHMLDCEIFAADVGDAGGHHMVNVALHVANAILLLLFLQQVTGSLWSSALVAALFALHPLRVESVAWVSERKDVLSGLFFMTTLLAYQFYVQRPAPRRYMLVFASLALGLMAKPMLVTLPLLLLLLDSWPFKRWEWPGPSSPAPDSHGPNRNHTPNPNRGSGLRLGLGLRFLVLEKVPLLGLALGATWITLATQSAGGATSAWGHIPLAARMANAAAATLGYLWNSLWPTQLACFYPHPALVSPDAVRGLLLQGVLCGLLLVGISVLVFRALPRRPYLAVGWGWYLLTLLPVSGVVQFGAQAMADRYTYIPMIGIVVAVVWALRDLVKARPQWRRVGAAAALVVLAALTVISSRQVRTWRNTDSLYQHALAVTHNNFFVHKMYGGFLLEQKAYDRVRVQYEQALALRPQDPGIHEGIGALHVKTGALPLAEKHLRQAIALGERDYACYGYLGEVLEQRGDAGAAAEQFQTVIALKPDFPDGYLALARVLSGSGQQGEAVATLQALLSRQPQNLSAHGQLGDVLAAMQDWAGAAKAYQEVLRIQPDHARAQLELNRMLRERGE
jgi:Tfp pilus assembly protein PilF